MADNGLHIVLDQTSPYAPTLDTRHHVLRALTNRLFGVMGGNFKANRLQVWQNGSAPRQARAVVLFSSGSGSVGATLNGVATTVTWATSDTNSATLFAAAVNASSNALIQYNLQACNIAGTVALSAVAAGDFIDINVPTQGATYRFTAKNGGTLDAAEFDMSGTDTQDAASLVTQINNRPGLNKVLIADSSSGTVTLRQVSGTSAAFSLLKSASTFTLTAPAATANTLISSLVPGKIGNCQTIAASGTGVSISGALTRLANGAGGDVTPLDFSF